MVHRGAQCHQTGADGRQDAHQIRVSALRKRHYMIQATSHKQSTISTMRYLLASTTIHYYPLAAPLSADNLHPLPLAACLLLAANQ
jgi:hypothetical protein